MSYRLGIFGVTSYEYAGNIFPFDACLIAGLEKLLKIY